ncbi:MAG: ATP-binding protein [Planctomycetota bacterium]
MPEDRRKTRQDDSIDEGPERSFASKAVERAAELTVELREEWSRRVTDRIPSYLPGKPGVRAKAEARRLLSRLSLADKCLVLFGGAIVLIVTLALVFPFLRMNAVVDEGQAELSRSRAQAWIELAMDQPLSPPADAEPVTLAGITARIFSAEEAAARAVDDRMMRRALRQFERGRGDWITDRWLGARRVYTLYVPRPEVGGVLVFSRESAGAGAMLAINGAYLVGAGSFVLLLAVLVFYLITHRIILEPVRELTETAERVRKGRLDVRSNIKTGDEFEELALAFNQMLGDLGHSQDQLRKINSALDLRINELSEANSTLADAARVKGEFLAKVSHELRTPLNSIIGFAELLHSIAKKELASGDSGPDAEKRLRYLGNIDNAGRNLLEQIETLLEMAKIEAGRVEVRAERVSIANTCEGLLGLINPLAERKGVELVLEVEDGLPLIETDVQKLQQILFNFLSNAVKFIDAAQPGTRSGVVTLRAERVAGQNSGGVRISVIDTGPGIDPEDQRRIFESFEQAEAGYARGHAGVGLGLAICKEFASLIQAEIQLVSEIGRGSMFSLIVPEQLDPERLAEQGMERAFRATLGGTGNQDAPTAAG